MDIDLCNKCYVDYEIDGYISRETSENCQAHPFLVVSGEEHVKFGSGSADFSLSQWLRTIIPLEV
jgi:hypothetical protein